MLFAPLGGLMKYKPAEIVRSLALGLMLCGLALSIWGQLRERHSFDLYSSVFEQGDAAERRERQLAYDLKHGGVVLVLAGPALWLVGSRLIRRRPDTNSSAA